MNLVMTVLLLAVLASAAFCIFGLMLMSGEGSELKKMTELYETGVEVRAELVGLAPFGKDGYASVTYAWESPEGSGRLNKGASVGPAHVVGERYPLVFDPQNTKRAHLGTKVAVRRELKRRRGYVRNARRMALLGFAAGALATVGMIVSP
ncbi:DUF3592 domain-containing protein [Streptomyces sp. NPDC048604]|uniref:DUF3592 domain-containing protein n=1 Tax=Streptomyces sp. NPDC048604 TaxID=3365578 RepID=UPI00371F5C24